MPENDTPPTEQSIEKLELSMRAYGFLKRTQINSIGDLMEYTQEDLEILDQESAQEVIESLQKHFGLSLPVD